MRSFFLLPAADSPSASTWWNPISWSWSSLSPTHWFGSSLQVSEAGVSIGTPFSDLYGKAFGACRKGQGADGDGVECKAPGSEHISYLFSGEWHGPEGLMPADDTLKSWKISKIIWRKG